MQGYSYHALKKEINLDKTVLKKLIQGIGTIYDNEAVGDLIAQNLYNKRELEEELRQERVCYSAAV